MDYIFITSNWIKIEKKMVKMKILVNYIFLPILLIVIFNFLEYGLSWDRLDKFIYPIILTMISMIIFLNTKIRKLFMILSFTLLFLMAALYLLDELNLSNSVGSFGFTIFLIVVASYIPEMIRQGYVEKI